MYSNKLRNLAFRLNALDTKIDNKIIISKILTTLPEEYGYFASALDSAEQREKTLENLTVRLIAKETRNNSKELEEKAVAFKITDRKCFKYYKTGHTWQSRVLKHHRQVKRDKYVISSVIKRCILQSRVEKSRYQVIKGAFARKLITVIRIVISRTRKAKMKIKVKSVLTAEISASDTWIVDSKSTSNMTNNNCIRGIKTINSVIGVAMSSGLMVAQGSESIEFDKYRLEYVMYICS